MLVLFPLVLLLLLPVIWCCYLARAIGIPQWREGALGMQWFGYDGAEHWELQWLKNMSLGHPMAEGLASTALRASLESSAAVAAKRSAGPT